MTVVNGAPLVGGLARGDRLDRWIRIGRDGTVTIFTGKVELGQGIHNALAQIVADELDVPFDRVRVAPVDTAYSPDEGTTSASRSIEESGAALRQVAAEIRHTLITAAARKLGVAGEDLSLDAGRISEPGGRGVTYAELSDGDFLTAIATGEPRPKRPHERRLIGADVRRRDLVPKITGQPAYVQDLDLPGMLHGRVVRPPSYGSRLTSVDEATILALPDVVGVVRDGSFLAVVADREEQAITALERARRTVTWEDGPSVSKVTDPRYLLDKPAEESVVHAHTGNAVPPVSSLEAEYSRQYIAHASVAPSCSVARLNGDGYTVWTHSQGIFALRHELAKILEVRPADVRVIHMEGAGCYGHNGADDVALDAALLARANPGRPVRVQWMRDDEFAWEPFGPAALVRLHAGLDAGGNIAEWVHHGWGHSHDGRPSESHSSDESALLAAQHLARPYREAARGRPETPSDGGQRNAVPLYEFPRAQIVDHYVADAPLRISALRSLGAHTNAFAIESFMDEIAAATGLDPIELRVRYLADPRALDVIDAVTSLARWVPGEKGANERGRGLGFARYKNEAAYAAVIVEVELDTEVRVRRTWAAIDAGMVVSRDGLLNQVEGGIVQAVSWTLHEAVSTDTSGIATRGWDTYRTLRFPDAPEVETVIVDRPEQPPLGAGEALTGPTAAAIANAVFNAIGLRVRDMPITRERVIAATG